MSPGRLLGPVIDTDANYFKNPTDKFFTPRLSSLLRRWLPL